MQVGESGKYRYCSTTLPYTGIVRVKFCGWYLSPMEHPESLMGKVIHYYQFKKA